NLGLGEGSALPVGVPVPWPSEVPPSGWLTCNGDAFSAADYPLLAKAYPSLRLPDLRGEFIRGWDDGRGVDSGRSLLSYQHGSVVVGDDGVSTNTLVTINNLNDLSRWGYDNTPLPSITGMYVSMTPATNDYVSNTWPLGIYGISRPRNLAFNYIVRAA
ncbi:tail fiber protein, partial [Pantoea allii]